MSTITAPFAWLLMTFYQFTGSYAFALILFSFVIKLVLFPFFMRGKKGMMKMTRLQPKAKELEKKYEGNQQKYSVELQKLYKEEKVNPMSGCLWNLIPFPILILLYNIIRYPLTSLMGVAEESLPKIAGILTRMGVTPADYETSYGQMMLAQQAAPYAEQVKAVAPQFVAMNFYMFGLNLAQNPSVTFFLQPDAWTWANIGLFLIPVISGAFAFAQVKISQKLNPVSADQNNKMMTMMSPIISVWIGFAMPASMSIYWIANSAFSIVQDVIATNHYKKIFDKEDEVKLAAEEERKQRDEEKKRLREEKAAIEGPAVDKNTSKKKIQNLERSRAEEAERAYKEKTGQMKPSDKSDRPFARGRAYDPARFAARQEENEAISDDAGEEVLPVAGSEASAAEGAPQQDGILSENEDENYEEADFDDETDFDDEDED